MMERKSQSFPRGNGCWEIDELIAIECNFSVLLHIQWVLLTFMKKIRKKRTAG